MKNANPYQGDAFAFYKEVCSKKQNAALVARIAAMDNDIRDLYDDYNLCFDSNTLETLDAYGYIAQNKTDLETLYDYGSATFTVLRNQLATTPTGRVVKCQSCTINDGNTFDHILPQGEFIEFIVHPRNLIGQCSDCNSRRNASWRIDGRRTTLNLYLDQLPNVQYLFVNTEVGNLAIETEFYLANPHGIDNDLFDLIDNHYNRLNLFDRFSDGADSVISSLRNIMEPLRSFHNLAETRQIASESVRKDQIAFGRNYWQSILKLELLDNEDFMTEYE